MSRRRKPVSIPMQHAGRWSNSWFELHTEELWQKWLLPLKGQVGTYLEIGVNEGRSMLWMLENVEPKQAIGLDPYRPDKAEHAEHYAKFRDNMQHNLAPYLASGQCVVHEASSFDFLRERHGEIADGSVDLCYLDGSHMAWDLMADVSLVWPKLKRPGGMLLFDDLQRNIHLGRSLTLVAVWAFEMCYYNRYERWFREGRQFGVRRIK